MRLIAALMNKNGPLSAFRVLQIRLLAKFLELCGKTDTGRTAIVWLRRHEYLNRLLTFLVGYRRTFPTFEQAATYAKHFQFVGHQHPDNIAHHSAAAERIKESDYPVLFHLSAVASNLRNVFDLGGSVGNLFYALASELRFPQDMVWTVYDLPLMRSEGEKLSAVRHEHRLRFTDSFSAASGCDFFITSGSLHYFEQPLAEILASLPMLPGRVLINRTPCASEAGAADEDLITIQDNHSYFVPSIIHSRKKLIGSLANLGYRLRSSWPVHERSLWVPLYPDRSFPCYWGFYFVREREDALPIARRLLDVASCAITAWLVPEFASLASQYLACA